MAEFQVTNTVAEEWTYRAHPKDAAGLDASGVTLVAIVVSGDGSVVQDPASPLDVRLLSGPAVGGTTVFSITGVGNVAPDLPADTVTMSQTALPVPPAASLGGELIGPNPQP